MARQGMVVLLTLLLMYLMLRNLASQQCGIDHYALYQKMLKDHTFKIFKTRPLSLDCKEACKSDIRCQSYNYVMLEDICELNNRTKEARPEDFVKDLGRYYMEKKPKDPLGSTSELPAYSCAEIKASEGGQAVSGNYWLDPTRSGNFIRARCDMKTEIADYYIKHRCLNNANCVNRNVNYTCSCRPGWTGTYCERDVDECVKVPNACPVPSSCVNSVGSYHCNCLTGWRNQGPHTCVDIDECTEGSYSCPSQSRCANTAGSYRCNCLSGWRNQGPHTCVDINECTQGSHSCSSYGNAYCDNTIGSYTCRCNRCYYKSGYKCKPDCRQETRYYYTKEYTNTKTYYSTSCGILGLGRCRRSKDKRVSKQVQRSRQVWIANRYGASCPC